MSGSSVLAERQAWAPRRRDVSKKPDQMNNRTVDPWKTKAVQKLYNVIEKVLSLKTPDIRRIECAKTNAEVKKIEAQSQAEAQAIKLLANAEAMAKARVIEAQGDLTVCAVNYAKTVGIRQWQNIETIIKEAHVALSASAHQISNEPVEEDFIHRFFDDCKNIGDEQMKSIWGRLLAGEIARPGSYHPKTLATLKDLTKADAESFAVICRFGATIDNHFSVCIFDWQNSIYTKYGINFALLLHLQDLGLLNFEPRNGYIFGPAQTVTYRSKIYSINLNDRNNIDLGQVSLSAVGRQLARLVDGPVVPEFWAYAVETWKRRGVILIQKTKMKMKLSAGSHDPQNTLMVQISACVSGLTDLPKR